jgi:hypothetical protein
MEIHVPLHVANLGSLHSKLRQHWPVCPTEHPDGSHGKGAGIVHPFDAIHYTRTASVGPDGKFLNIPRIEPGAA